LLKNIFEVFVRLLKTPSFAMSAPENRLFSESPAGYRELLMPVRYMNTLQQPSRMGVD
jgi:hypothetical protein